MRGGREQLTRIDKEIRRGQRSTRGTIKRRWRDEGEIRRRGVESSLQGRLEASKEG